MITKGFGEEKSRFVILSDSEESDIYAMLVNTLNVGE